MMDNPCRPPCWPVPSAPAKLLISCELMAHCKEDSNYVFPEIKLRGLIPNFSCIWKRFIYSQDRSAYFVAA
jgi:hypothetical protein